MPIGILVLDSEDELKQDKDELKQDKVGARSPGKSAAIRGVLLRLAPAHSLSASSAARRPGAPPQGLGLTDADKARLTSELTAGNAAVGVFAEFTPRR